MRRPAGLAAAAVVLATLVSSCGGVGRTPHASGGPTPSQVADPGLPSHLGKAPLRQAQVEAVVQYLENQVARAYATGAPDALYRYLAGPMLTGNRATINVFNSQHRRNVFNVKVLSVNIDSSDPHRIVAEMKGAMTTDYFTDAATRQVVAGGLPGPSALDFELFLDFNPVNHTWYWTGEEPESDGSQGS